MKNKGNYCVHTSRDRYLVSTDKPMLAGNIQGMEPKIQDKEWAAFYLGQFAFASIGPAEALDTEPISKKARRDWNTATKHAMAAAKYLGLKLDFGILLEKKGTQAKHAAMGKLLAGILDHVEARHGRAVANLVSLGNITAACMGYGTKSKEVRPIQLGFLEISKRLYIPESISHGFLDDPVRNLETFAAIAVQKVREAVIQKPRAFDAIEIKPGAFGITLDVKKLLQQIIERFKAKRGSG